MWNKHRKRFVRELLICVCAGCIPGMLALSVMQSHRFSLLTEEITALEQRQSDLFEDNQRLISGISILGSSDRIERISRDQLGMKKAQSEHMLRIEIVGAGTH